MEDFFKNRLNLSSGVQILEDFFKNRLNLDSGVQILEDFFKNRLNLDSDVQKSSTGVDIEITGQAANYFELINDLPLPGLTWK